MPGFLERELRGYLHERPDLRHPAAQAVHTNRADGRPTVLIADQPHKRAGPNEEHGRLVGGLQRAKYVVGHVAQLAVGGDHRRVVLHRASDRALELHRMKLVVAGLPLGRVEVRDRPSHFGRHPAVFPGQPLCDTICVSAR